MDDLYSLIMELAENGVVHLDFSNQEDYGIKVEL